MDKDGLPDASEGWLVEAERPSASGVHMEIRSVLWRREVASIPDTPPLVAVPWHSREDDAGKIVRIVPVFLGLEVVRENDHHVIRQGILPLGNMMRVLAVVPDNLACVLLARDARPMDAPLRALPLVVLASGRACFRCVTAPGKEIGKHVGRRCWDLSHDDGGVDRVHVGEVEHDQGGGLDWSSGTPRTMI